MSVATMALQIPPRADPIKLAAVGCYMTDGTRLIEILEVDSSGAIGVDLLSDKLIELDPLQLSGRWRRVTPSKDGPGT